MSDYAEIISGSSCKTINDIIDLCYENLPVQWRIQPWKHPELIRGIGLLESDDALNCYMAAYGDMHVSKCRAALLDFPFNELIGHVEIVDWGCGQGIGSATFVDVLQQRGLLYLVKKITLIEPSSRAINRAVCNILKITDSNIEIDAINAYLPANYPVQGETLKTIGYRCNNVVHIFSNILDVKAIDLGALARLVASSHGKHYILCMGPKNSAAYRIEQFCSIFGEQRFFSRIDSVRYGRTTKTGYPYTCMTRCFVYNGNPIDLSRMTSFYDSGEVVLNDYDMQLMWQNKIMSLQKARVAFRLQNILSVDDVIYIDPIVNEVAVDFIIVRPNRGMILINIFDKNLNDCTLSNDKKEIIVRNCQKGNTSKTYHSPIELINLCQTSIKDGIEELLISTIESGKNFGLIKKVVIFTENDIESIKRFFGLSNDNVNYTFLYGNDFIINKVVSQGLYEKIGLIDNSPIFDDTVKHKIAKIISPSWHSYLEGKIGVEPKGAQKKLVVSHPTQQKISGVAGSGKTFVLAMRAVNAMKRTGGDVLILTYNITLANYIRFRLSELREDFSWEKIDIYPYHQFFRIRASECKLRVGFGSYDEVSFFCDSPNHKRYSSIFVDEVQDYTTEWLRILLNNFLEPNGEFVVFGDPKQNVYHRPKDDNGDIRLGVIGGVWNKELITGRRFTNPKLANIAMAFQAQFLSELPVDTIKINKYDDLFDFNIISYYDMRLCFTEDNLVLKLIEIIRNSHNNIRDFVVLALNSKLLQLIDFKYRQITGEKTEISFVSTEQYLKLKNIHGVSDRHPINWKFNRDYQALGRTRKQLFTTDKRCLKLSTIKSFKGWESPSVIVILDDSYGKMDSELVYSAITRARENLYVVNIGNDTFDQFFKFHAL